MARLTQQEKEAGAMKKIKQRLDSMQLKYTEKVGDKSTMIKVRSMQTTDERNNGAGKREER